MRQLSSWYEINVTHKLNRFITISIDSIVIYEMLLVLAVVAVVGSWYVSTTRLGHALQFCDRRASDRGIDPMGRRRMHRLCRRAHVAT